MPVEHGLIALIVHHYDDEWDLVIPRRAERLCDRVIEKTAVADENNDGPLRRPQLEPEAHAQPEASDPLGVEYRPYNR